MRGFFRCGHSYFLVQKNSDCFKVYGVSARTEEEGLSQCGHFVDKEKVNFSQL